MGEVSDPCQHEECSTPNIKGHTVDMKLNVVLVVEEMPFPLQSGSIGNRGAVYKKEDARQPGNLGHAPCAEKNQFEGEE